MLGNEFGVRHEKPARSHGPPVHIEHVALVVLLLHVAAPIVHVDAFGKDLLAICCYVEMAKQPALPWWLWKAIEVLAFLSEQE